MSQVEATKIEDPDDQNKVDEFKKELVSKNDESPIYEVIPVLKTTSISPGDDIELKIYLTGKGIPKKSKLCINYAGIPVDTSDDGRIEYSIHLGVADDSSLVGVAGEDFINKVSFPDHYIGAFVTGLNPLYFSDDPKGQDELEEYHYQPTMAEIEHGGVPPISVIIPTSESVNPGTYDITSSLVYEGNDAEPSISTNVVEVEIQDWVDRNRRKLRKWGILLATITVVLAIVSLSLDLVTTIS